MCLVTVIRCKGGMLASIEDPSEQQFLKSNAEIFQDSFSSFWIGLYKTHKGIITLFGNCCFSLLPFFPSFIYLTHLDRTTTADTRRITAT